MKSKIIKDIQVIIKNIKWIIGEKKKYEINIEENKKSNLSTLENVNFDKLIKEKT